MMNNYFTSDSEFARRSQMQERHYELLNRLQSLSSEVPTQFQQRLPYELLSNLASCLLDETIPQIVAGLKDIQQITEKALFERRMKVIGKFRELKVDQQKRHRQALSDGSITYEQMLREERELEKYIEEETNKTDMKIITELDQVVSDQQVTLEKAGVPGFMVTNNPTEIRVQMYIIEFITRISEREPDS